MTKYISLVQANVNDISQLKKEIEYLSDFTEDIELVNKIFVQVDLLSLDLMTYEK
jgi:hypothetical protein